MWGAKEDPVDHWETEGAQACRVCHSQGSQNRVPDRRSGYFQPVLMFLDLIKILF